MNYLLLSHKSDPLSFHVMTKAIPRCAVIESTGAIWSCPPENGIEYTLQELRRIVGGHIEILHQPELEFLFVIDEEGKCKAEPAVNQAATMLAHQFDVIRPDDVLVGAVLICPVNFIR